MTELEAAFSLNVKIPFHNWARSVRLDWHLNTHPQIFRSDGAWDPLTLKRVTPENVHGEWCSPREYRRGDIIIYKTHWLMLSDDTSVRYVVRVDLRQQQEEYTMRKHAMIECNTSGSDEKKMSFDVIRAIIWALDLTFGDTMKHGALLRWRSTLSPENDLERWLPAKSVRFLRKYWSVEVCINKTATCTHSGRCRNPPPHYVMYLAIFFDSSQTGVQRRLGSHLHKLYAGAIDGLTPRLDFSQLAIERQHARRVAFADYRFITRPNVIEIESALRGHRYLPDASLEHDWHWPHYILTEVAPLLFDCGLFVFPVLWIVNYLRGMLNWDEHTKWVTLEAVYQSRRRVREARGAAAAKRSK